MDGAAVMELARAVGDRRSSSVSQMNQESEEEQRLELVRPQVRLSSHAGLALDVARYLHAPHVSTTQTDIR
jgi:hypothetical protein